ncbi:hypothetical protein QYE76_028288 [Lolium multiflorum]|uniref:Uncharacterized protein n=1 Tax=Lolium multiflorum TaxID=4521 RepID=A0AAD8QLM0_LOLMU|nr:hypothetical protein QYE76_028288 [Lolium multiflorum]
MELMALADIGMPKEHVAKMAQNVKNATMAVLLVAIMVVAVLPSTGAAAEGCWEQCIEQCKGGMDVCSPKCNAFCKNQAAAVWYFSAATDKLKEAKTASPEKAAALKKEADQYLATSKTFNDAAGTP